MGDEGEGFDFCACLNHDLALQRLLSILRQTQSYCTDNECLTVSRLPGPEGASSPENNFMMVFLIAIVGILLYLFRPSSLRQSGTMAKRRDSDAGNDGEPPLPPAVN